MKIKNRLFKHSEDSLKKAMKVLSTTNKDAKVFKEEILKGMSTDTKGAEVPNAIEIANRIEDFAEIIKNNGFDPESQKKLSIAELSSQIEDFLANDGEYLTRDLSAPSVGFFVTQTITRLVSKMEVPELEAWQFVSRELIVEEGTTIYNVIFGTNGHGTTRIAEGGEYNILTVESAEDYIKTVGWKVGVKVKYSEECKRRMGIAGIKLLVEAALNDIKRYKSLEALHLLEANAKTFFDGLDPKKMPSGVTKADLKKKNGTLIMRDLRDFFSATQTQGFDVDVMYIHPLAYSIFMNDKTVQQFFKENANVYFLLPKKKQTISHNLLTKMKSITSGTTKAAEGQEVIVAPIDSKSYNIIVTPFVKFHKKGEVINKPETRYTAHPMPAYESAPNNCTDILMVDSSRALTYAHNGNGVISDTIANRFVDTEEIKFKTYYSFILDKDHGVFAFRNINITRDVVDIDNMPEVITYTHADVTAEK